MIPDLFLTDVSLRISKTLEYPNCSLILLRYPRVVVVVQSIHKSMDRFFTDTDRYLQTKFCLCL